MQAISRTSGKAGTRRRRFRYICSTFWNRGATVCSNSRMAMEIADAEIREVLAREVLRAAVLERALDLAIAELRPPDRARERAHRRAEVTKTLREVERKLGNLAEAVVNDGAVPAVLTALTRMDAERQALTRELATLDKPEPHAVAFDPAALRKQLRAMVDDWQALAAGNVDATRGLLEVVRRDRIVWKLPTLDSGEVGDELKLPIALDRMLTSIVPALDKQGLRPQVDALHVVSSGGLLRVRRELRTLAELKNRAYSRNMEQYYATRRSTRPHIKAQPPLRMRTRVMLACG